MCGYNPCQICEPTWSEMELAHLVRFSNEVVLRLYAPNVLLLIKFLLRFVTKTFRHPYPYKGCLPFENANYGNDDDYNNNSKESNKDRHESNQDRLLCICREGITNT